jgi:hypothetical protein
MFARQEFIGQLIGALRTPTVLADAARAAEPPSVLALRLAANAGASDHDAGLAANLVGALQDRVPLAGGHPEALRNWGQVPWSGVLRWA